MDLTPVPGERALVIEGEERLLVIADLHVGIEADYHEAGITLPSQTGHLVARMTALAEAHRPDRIVLLGDVKDSVAMVTRQEVDELPGFLARAADLAPLTIVPGNHDGNLAKFVPGWGEYRERIDVAPARGLVVGDVGLFHGHTYPSEDVARKPTLVMGHQHPAVAFRDGLGTRMAEACWVRAPVANRPFFERYGIEPAAGAEIVVMPAFTEYGRGSPVNADDELLGPWLNNGFADMDAARVFLLDGVELGKLGDLRHLLRGPGEPAFEVERGAKDRGSEK